MKLEFFSPAFRNMFKYEISWKSVQLEPSFSMRTDGQTDMTKLIVAFHSFLCSRHESIRENGCVPPPFLKLCTKWGKWASRADRLSPGRRLQYVFYRRLGGPQSQEDFWSREKSLALPGIRTPVCSARSLDTMLTGLPHFHKCRKEWS